MFVLRLLEALGSAASALWPYVKGTFSFLGVTNIREGLEFATGASLLASMVVVRFKKNPVSAIARFERIVPTAA